MTKTFSPVFRLPDALPDDVEPPDAAEPPDVVAVDPAELELLEQAARATVATTGTASASFLARLRFISLYPFNSVPCGRWCGWCRGVGGRVRAGRGGGAGGPHWAGKRWPAAGRRSRGR